MCKQIDWVHQTLQLQSKSTMQSPLPGTENCLFAACTVSRDSANIRADIVDFEPFRRYPVHLSRSRHIELSRSETLLSRTKPF